MSPRSAIAELARDGALVVMTPPAPPGVDVHAPAVVTVVQIDGDVTTTVASSQLTTGLWEAHQEALAARLEEVRLGAAELRRVVDAARTTLRFGLPGLGSLGSGTAGWTLGLGGAAPVDLWAWAVVVGPAVVGGLLPMLRPVRRRVERAVVGWAMRWVARYAAEGAGWTAAG